MFRALILTLCIFLFSSAAFASPCRQVEVINSLYYVADARLIDGSQVTSRSGAIYTLEDHGYDWRNVKVRGILAHLVIKRRGSDETFKIQVSKHPCTIFTSGRTEASIIEGNPKATLHASQGQVTIIPR